MVTGFFDRHISGGPFLKLFKFKSKKIFEHVTFWQSYTCIE